VQSATKRLLALTAADLMTSPVMTIPQNTSLREAARLLRGSNISGAPVVDAHGRCVSVLSSTDFVTWAGEDGPTLSFIAPWGEMIDVEGEPDNEIRHYMTTDVVTVAPATQVGELARKMVDAHIHRLVVVVDQDRPCGIVTSTDVLAAVGREAQHGAPRGQRKPLKKRKVAH
jgi:CBS domain-containing protein